MAEATDGLIATGASMRADCSVFEGDNEEGTPGSEPELEVDRHLMLEDGRVQVQGSISENVPPQPGDDDIEDCGGSDVDCTMADAVAQQPTATAAGASTDLQFDYEWKELPPLCIILGHSACRAPPLRRQTHRDAPPPPAPRRSSATSRDRTGR